MSIGSLLCVVVVASLAAPLGDAAVTVQVTAPGKPVVPDAESAKLVVRVTLDCSDLAKATIDPAAQKVRVLLGVSANAPGILLAGPAALDFPLALCAPPATAASQEAVLQVTATRMAPGERSIVLQATATLPPGPAPNSAAVTGSSVGMMTVAYMGFVDAKAMSSIVSLRGTAHMDLFRIENLGNARTQVDVVVVGPLPDGLTVTPPAAVILDSPNDGPSTLALTGPTVRVEGSWHEAEVTFRFVPHSTLSPELEGPSAEAHVLVRNGNGVLGLPAAGPISILAALACAALAVRRRA